jgi:hypothetical protein
MKRSAQDIAIENVITRNPIAGSQLAVIQAVFHQTVLAENNGCWSEAIADVDALIARLTAHRKSLENCRRPVHQFVASDINPDTCSVCGKYRSYAPFHNLSTSI